MLKKLLISISVIVLFLGLSVNSNPKKIRIIKPDKDFVRVAVIDTGLNPNDVLVNKHLCKQMPYKDLTETSINDEITHGSLVLKLIRQNAADGNYCFHVIKYHDHLSTHKLNGQRFLQALELVNRLKPDVVNISSGGPNYEGQEYNIIKNNPKTVFVSAAGNDNENLNESVTKYYPASYALYPEIKNVVVVGALDEMGKKLHSSNWGDVVSFWKLGEYKEGSGTSFAAPVYTGELIKYLTSVRVVEEE